MLSRRGFFKAVAGTALAVGTGAVAAPAEASVGIDMAAGADFSAITTMTIEGDATLYTIEALKLSGSIEPVKFSAFSPYVQAFAEREKVPLAMLTGEVDHLLPDSIREFSQEKREQLAAELPVIGKSSLPADKRVPKSCSLPPSPRETGEQYRRRVGTKCPGMLE